MMRKKIPGSQRKLARAAQKIIDEYPLFEIAKMNASEMARLLGVSLANLSRAYKNCYSYPLSLRLQFKKFTAFVVLVESYGVGTVKEALRILDINSVSHFTSRFIKRFKNTSFGTPGEFCRKCKKRRQGKNKPKYILPGSPGYSKPNPRHFFPGAENLKPGANRVGRKSKH